jgi:hypothetical protein
MRFQDLAYEGDFLKIRELAPTVAAPIPGAAPVPGAAPTPGQPAAAKPAGLATGQMDPAQAAQAAKDRIEQKKQLQDQIKQLEQQIADARKQ